MLGKGEAKLRKFKLEIAAGNSAFCGLNGEASVEARSREIANILRRLADRIESGAHSDHGGHLLRDSNGAAVGFASCVAKIGR